MPKYDLIVVGAGIGGLAAAALAAKKNQRTIVLEQDSSVGGALAGFRKNGLVFSPGPNLSYGFERTGALHNLHETLGIHQTAVLHSPAFQVALPGRRITVCAEQTETLEELKREYPAEFDKIRKFYGDLRRLANQYARSALMTFLSHRRSAEGLIAAYGFSREFTAFLDVQSFYFFGRPAARLSRFQLVTLCDSPPLTLPGGFQKLSEQILEVLWKNGGEIRYQIPFSDVTITGSGVSLPDWQAQGGRVLINPVQERRRHVLCLAVREHVIPVGMLPEVLYAPAYDHPEQHVTLSVGTPHVAPGPSEPRLSTLTASFSLAYRLSPEERVQIIRSLIPFLDEFLLFAADYPPPSRSIALPKDISLKAVRTVADESILSGSSKKGFYMLIDEARNPRQSIAAAQGFIERILT